MLDREEFERWFRTAMRNLESARGDMERSDHNWACFKSHQAAELALKALLHGLGLPTYGHSVVKMLKNLADKGLNASEELWNFARELDKYYIPTRYPNAWVEGSPFEYYTVEDANKAINASKHILKWVEDAWRSLEEELKKEKE